MATFESGGIDELMLSLQDLAALPDSVETQMLRAGAAVAVAAHKRKLASIGLVRSRTLANSPAMRIKRARADAGGRRYALVYPAGVHGTYKARAGGEKITTNAEVGFIYEYGAPHKHIPARQWMREANETCADDVVRAEAAVYDKWLQSKNL